MDFDKLTKDLVAQDETIRHCAEAIRQRGIVLKDPAWICAAAWLASEQGRGAIIDVAIREQMSEPECTCSTARFEDDPCPAHGAAQPGGAAPGAKGGP